MKTVAVNAIIDRFIQFANAFDTEKALALFASNAVIDDVSVGEKFVGTAGVRKYLEQFFVGYKTVTKLLLVEVADELHAKAKVDFTGGFGHETGWLHITLHANGLIKKIDASLE